MEKIQCKICGKYFKRVCSHVRQIHLISAREYKEEFGYDVSKGIMTEDDREKMRRYALENKMDEQLKKSGQKTRFQKGQSLGKYKRSEQTMEKLRVLYKLSSGPKRKRVTITCHTCGKTKEIIKSQVKERNYCSRSCSTIHRNKILNKLKCYQ